MTDTLVKTDDQRFIEAMHAAVEERGRDFIYPKPEYDAVRAHGYVTDDWHVPQTAVCVYALPTGEPGCLIGMALHKIDPTFVPSYDDSAAMDEDMDADSVLTRLGDEGKLVLSLGVKQAARMAQQKQDGGLTWGTAIQTFDEVCDDV